MTVVIKIYIAITIFIAVLTVIPLLKKQSVIVRFLGRKMYHSLLHLFWKVFFVILFLLKIIGFIDGTYLLFSFIGVLITLVISELIFVANEKENRKHLEIERQKLLDKLIQVAENELDNANICFEMGLRYSVNKEWESANKYYKLAIERNPTIARYYNELARNYFGQENRNLEGAIDMYKKSYQINPKQKFVLNRIKSFEKLLNEQKTDEN